MGEREVGVSARRLRLLAPVELAVAHGGLPDLRSQPGGHHLTSVLLHALNSLLVFVVLRKMTGRVWRSLLVAALFGLHPLHVESVAWIAERKDVLGTLFWLLTIWAYAHWVQQRAAHQPRALDLLLAGPGVFCAGTDGQADAGHGSVCPAAAGFLAVEPDWRHSQPHPSPRGCGPWSRRRSRFLRSRRRPVIGAYLAQRQIGALKSAAGYPWPDRIANALVAYCRYLGKCVFPVNFAVFYPYALHRPPGRPCWPGRCSRRSPSPFARFTASGLPPRRMVLVSRHPGAGDWPRAGRRAIDG